MNQDYGEKSFDQLEQETIDEHKKEEEKKEAKKLATKDEGPYADQLNQESTEENVQVDEAALRSDADPGSLKTVAMDAAMQYADQGSNIANSYSEKHTSNSTTPAAGTVEKKEAPKTTSTQKDSFYAQILSQEIEKDPNAVDKLS